MATRLTPERLAEIAIFNNVKSIDIPALLAHIAALEAELITARSETQRLVAALVETGKKLSTRLRDHEVESLVADALAGSRAMLDATLAEARRQGAIEALEAAAIELRERARELQDQA